MSSSARTITTTASSSRRSRSQEVGDDHATHADLALTAISIPWQRAQAPPARAAQAAARTASRADHRIPRAARDHPARPVGDFDLGHRESQRRRDRSGARPRDAARQPSGVSQGHHDVHADGARPQQYRADERSHRHRPRDHAGERQRRSGHGSHTRGAAAGERQARFSGVYSFGGGGAEARRAAEARRPQAAEARLQRVPS